LTQALEQVMGTPYLWGGSSTFGFDCSGLVQFIFGLFGIRLPRNSSDQARAGRPVGGLDLLRPMDLVFFGDRGAVNHVAIHVGDRMIIHASGHVKMESLDPESSLFRDDLARRFMVARRVLPPSRRVAPTGAPRRAQRSEHGGGGRRQDPPGEGHRRGGALRSGVGW
jgi:cell wall-associated NlpC family hydrolase